MNLLSKNYLHLIFIGAIFSGTTQRTWAQNALLIDTNNYQTLRIDPATASGGYVSDLIETLDYIPLETTKESLFGGISQLEILSNHYVIYDYDTNCILIFNQDGKFQAKIKGNSARSGKKINEFSVNRWTNQIIFSNDRYKTLTYADLKGKIIKTVNRELVLPYEVSFDNYQFIGPNKTVHFQRNKKIGEEQKSSALLNFIDNFRTTQAVAFPYSRNESQIDVLLSGIGPLTYSGTDTTLFFSKPYEYSVYSVHPKQISLAYKFVLPGPTSLPADFLGPRFDPEKRFPFIDKHRDIVFCLNNFYQIKNTLFFEASVHGVYKEDCLLYNLKSGSLAAYKHITPDEKSYNLPIYDPVGIVFQDSGLAACDGEFLYTSLSSLTMFDAKANINGQKFSAKLTNYFTKGKKSDNPVVLKLKFKDKF